MTRKYILRTLTTRHTMRRFPRFIVACSLYALTACDAEDEGRGPQSIARISVPAINVAEIDSVIASVVADKKLVGVSAGIMQDGKVVLNKGYGLRSLSPREPVTPTTMFPIGSVTKQFVCSAALLLDEDDKLEMEDPVSKYVPNATRAKDITLLDLGQHVAGYRDYYPLDFVVPEMQKDEPADTIIARYATRPLDFEPGSRWSYSNTGFTILGKAIESASGEDLGAFLAKRIFTPLGMTRTAYDPATTDTGMAKGYTSYALAAPTLSTPEGRGWTGAAGAIWSTPADLLAWDLALMEGRVLSAESWDVMTTPRRLSDGRSTGYGCGLGIQAGGAALQLSHGGAVAGSVSQNILFPATRSAIVLFSNADFAAMGPILNAVVPKLVPQVDVPKIAGLSALDAAKAFLASVEAGKVDRATLGDDFNSLLTADHLARDRASLKALGKVSDVRVVQTRERGGMEVAVVQYLVGTTAASSLMYRTPDGKIQQFLINRR
jgi:D-alanyl-D-alanine carboxypeptidase